MAYNYEYPGVNMNDYNNDWILHKMKELISEWSSMQKEFKDLEEIVLSLKEYLNNLNIENAVDKIITELIENGNFFEIIGSLIPYYTPEMFGCVCDGNTDDTANFSRMLETIPDNALIYIRGNDKLLLRSIEFIRPVNIISHGTLISKERRDAFLHFNNQNGSYIYLNRVQDTTLNSFHGWNSESYIGVKFTNLWNCVVNMQNIINFTVGVELEAVGGLSGGFTNNRFHTGRVQNCLIGMMFTGNGAQSWINSNVFYGGWFSYSDSEGVETFKNVDRARYGIVENFTNGNEFPFDSNIFYDLKFDITGITAGTYTTIRLTRAVNWEFIDYRLEMGSENVFFAILDAMYNNVYGIKFKPNSEFREYVTNVSINVENNTFNRSLLDIYSCSGGYNDTTQNTIYNEKISGRCFKYLNDFSIIKGMYHLNQNNESLDDTSMQTGERTYLYGRNVFDVQYPVLYETVIYIQVEKNDTFTIEFDEKTYRSSYVMARAYKNKTVVDVQSINALDYYFQNGNYKPAVNKSDVTFSISGDVDTIALLFFGPISSITIKSNRQLNIYNSVFNERQMWQQGFAHTTPDITEYWQVGDLLLNSGSSPSYGYILEYETGKKWRTL